MTEGYRRPPSTRWVVGQPRVTRPPARASKHVASGARWARYARLRPRERITLTIRYRGGAEAWYEIEARGSMGRFPGVVCLHDVVQEITQGRAWYIEVERLDRTGLDYTGDHPSDDL